MSVATPEPSMPSRLSRRPAASRIRRLVDPIAKEHHVIAFDNRGVGASTGQVPDNVEAMADDAYTVIRALGFDKVDIFSFSLGGFVAQALVIKHPELVVVFEHVVHSVEWRVA